MNDLKVLYIGGEAIGGRSATGQSLGTMYGALRPDQVVQLCDRVAPWPRCADGPAGPARIIPARGTLRASLAWLRGMKIPVVARVHDGLNASTAGAGADPSSRRQASLRAAADMIPPRLSRRTIDELRAWRPDVIHTPLGGARMMRLALLASRTLQVPLLPHLLDDWPTTLYSGGELHGLARRVALRELARLLARSPTLLTTGRAMATEYRQRYRRECVAIGNSADPAAYRAAGGGGRRRAPHELLYVGGLHLGRAEVLRTVARALEGMPEPWRVVVHAPARDVEHLLGRDVPPCLTVGRELEPDQVPARLCSAGALLFVESLRAEIAAFTRLSVSTKVPQYLAARRPIVALGPLGQASVEEIAQCAGAAVVVHGTGDADLAPVVEFLHAVAASGELPEKALPEWFDAAVVQRRFVEVLRAVAPRPTHAASVTSRDRSE